MVSICHYLEAPTHSNRLAAAGHIYPPKRSENLRTHLGRLRDTAESEDFDNFDRLKPLLRAALAEKHNDLDIWKEACEAIAESIPPQSTTSYQQTPWVYTTSSLVDSLERREHFDNVLKNELGNPLIASLGFYDTYFGEIENLEAVSLLFFNKCKDEGRFIDNEGWHGWPKDAQQNAVLIWFAELVDELAVFADGHTSTPPTTRRPLAQPDKPVRGSRALRKPDVAFVDDPKALESVNCRWSDILVLGELKSNPLEDKHSGTWLDLGRYAREVFLAQDSRRFVLGFSLCGSMMRIWSFDRLGVISSRSFNINEDGQRFVFTMLGFLWMNDKQLGFDPTIIKQPDGNRVIEIQRGCRTERLFIDSLIGRRACIVGRATTCWKAYSEDAPQTPLVIKDSWQLLEHGGEGQLLREVAEKKVENVVRYYHHETVQILGKNDDVRDNVRRGLETTMVMSYQRQPSKLLLSPNPADLQGQSRSSSGGGKRSSSQTDSLLPPAKLSRSESPGKVGGGNSVNRVHHRVILGDYGKPIYESTSHAALLKCLIDCIRGHRSLLNAGVLHRDISIYNLMINEEGSSCYGFLIDLDLAIRVSRESSSGAKGITGTRVFMAIGALLGEPHTFMHDLESFFWVFFWLCAHYEAPGRAIKAPEFDAWNYENNVKLATSKMGLVLDDTLFKQIAGRNFTSYHEPLLSCVEKLRYVIFPNGKRWGREDLGLYDRMENVLQTEMQQMKKYTEIDGNLDDEEQRGRQ